MPSQFTIEYAVFVFLSTLGVLQVVFATNGIRGLLFIRPSRRASALLGAALVIGAIVWFFFGDSRNVPDTTTGLDGNEQSLWFALSAAAAVAATLLLTSLLNHRWGQTHLDGPPGLDILAQTTYFQAMRSSLRKTFRKAHISTPQ
jgi:hypothetical protein